MDIAQSTWDLLAQVETLLGLIGVSLLSTLYYMRETLNSALHRFRRHSFDTVSEYVKSRLPEELDLQKRLKTRISIAIVDDQPEDFPIDYLQELGFSINIFEKISLAQTDLLSRYDIVFLDIVGVVTQDPEKGGLTLLRKLKDLPSPPFIVAVSGQKFDTTANDFFNMADHVIKKPLFEDECERLLTDLLTDNFLPHAAARRIDQTVNSTTHGTNSRQKIITTLIKFLDGDLSQKRARRSLMRKYGFDSWQQIRHELDTVSSWIRTTKP